MWQFLFLFLTLITHSEEGLGHHAATMPAGITTWVIEAVGVSQDHGMCVADPIKLEVRPPFFIDILMPYSVQRFEQIEIIVSVFNYADIPLQVKKVLETYCLAQEKNPHIGPEPTGHDCSILKSKLME